MFIGSPQTFFYNDRAFQLASEEPSLPIQKFCNEYADESAFGHIDRFKIVAFRETGQCGGSES